MYQTTRNASFAEKNRIRITAQYLGCGSPVGKQGGEQFLLLGKGCGNFRQIAHELGHALGLHHTMQRHDRDNYITVKKENIMVSFFREDSKDNCVNSNLITLNLENLPSVINRTCRTHTKPPPNLQISICLRVCAVF